MRYFKAIIDNDSDNIYFIESSEDEVLPTCRIECMDNPSLSLVEITEEEYENRCSEINESNRGFFLETS